MLKTYLSSIPILFASFFDLIGGMMHSKNPGEEGMNKAINSTAIQLEKKYQLTLDGRGGGSKEGKISMEFLNFELNKKLTKDESRRLLVDVVNLALKHINSDPNLTEHLYNPPFTYKNLEITIFFNNPDHSEIFHPEIQEIALLGNGAVKYGTISPDDRFQYKSIVNEPFEEALKIVAQEQAAKKP